VKTILGVLQESVSTRKPESVQTRSRFQVTQSSNSAVSYIINQSRMASNNEKFPVTNKQAAKIIQGIHTEVLVSGFQDKIFVVVTQYGRIGSMVRANMISVCSTKQLLMVPNVYPFVRSIPHLIYRQILHAVQVQYPLPASSS
jgi:hypothetical protein